MEPKYIINEFAGRFKMARGYARYPEDFPHLKDTGKDFFAWKEAGSGSWHIETTLSGEALLNELRALPVPEEADLGVN